MYAIRSYYGLRLENQIEDWVRAIRTDPYLVPDARLSWNDRMRAGLVAVKDIVGKVWLYVILGIAVGAGIHGYAPENFLAGIMGRDAWWSVPAAVAVGIPMYSNAAGIIPVRNNFV